MSILARLERASQQAERYRWWALGITTCGQATVATLPFGIGPLAPLIQDDLQISRAEIGLILTCVSLSTAVVGLIAGRAADFVGERRVLLVSGLLAGLSALFVVAIDGLWPLLVVGFVIGLGVGIQNPVGSVAVLRWFPRRGRGLAMGVRQTGVPLGGVLAASIWPFVGLAFGWRAGFVVGGCLTLLGAALIYFGYFDPARPAGASVAPPSLRSLLANPQIWWLSVIYNGQIIAQYAVTTYFVLFLHEVLGAPLVLAASLLAVVNFVSILARIGWGVVSDRWFDGRRRPALLMVLALTLSGMLIAAATPPNAPLALGVGLAVLFGLSAVAWTGLVNAVAAESAGREAPGSAIALIVFLGSPGTLLGTPAFGLLADLTGSYRAGWLAVATLVLVGLFALRRVTEHHSGSSGSG